MTNNDELALKLKAAAEKATVLNLDTAQIERGNDGYYECPVCCGEGEVEAKTDFCNIDGVALGVQFYGIGEHHGAAEEYFRAVAPANILALLAERDADKKKLESWRSLAKKNIEEHEKAVIALDATRLRIAELESKLAQNESWSLAAQKYIAEMEARTVSVKLPAVYDLVGDCDGNGNLNEAEMVASRDGIYARVSDIKAAGIKLEVGE